MALGKKTGGRQKGTPNKRTAANMALVAQATSEGISPLEVMLKAMRDAWSNNKIDQALQAAVHAAPYVHPRLAASQVTVDDKRTAEQFTDAELEALVRAGSARAAETATCEAEPDQVH